MADPSSEPTQRPRFYPDHTDTGTDAPNPSKTHEDFDGKGLDLAEHFIMHEEGFDMRDANDLAQAIQDAVKDWFEDKRYAQKLTTTRRT